MLSQLLSWTLGSLYTHYTCYINEILVQARICHINNNIGTAGIQ